MSSSESFGLSSQSPVQQPQTIDGVANLPAQSPRAKAATKFADGRRPSMTNRSCSYQSSDRYRSTTSNPASFNFSLPPPAQTIGNNPYPRGTYSMATPGPLPSHTPSSYNPLSTPQAQTPAASAQSAYGQPSPFFPGHYLPHAPSRTGTSQGAPNPSSAPGSAPGSPGPSLWGPASPSLTASFQITSDEPDQVANNAAGTATSATESNPQNLQRPAVPLRNATTGSFNPNEIKNLNKSFAFTLHVPRQLTSAPFQYAASAHSGGESQPETTHAEPTNRVIMVAIEATDSEGLHTLEWACQQQLQSGDTLIIARVVKQMQSFRGGFAAASDLLDTVLIRAREEASRIACHAVRLMALFGRVNVEIKVRYRVGDTQACLRDLASAIPPEKLVVESSRKRIAKTHFPGREGISIPADIAKSIVEAQ